jgi:hypothetical protein
LVSLKAISGSSKVSLSVEVNGSIFVKMLMIIRMLAAIPDA